MLIIEWGKMKNHVLHQQCRDTTICNENRTYAIERDDNGNPKVVHKPGGIDTTYILSFSRDSAGKATDFRIFTIILNIQTSSKICCT